MSSPRFQPAPDMLRPGPRQIRQAAQICGASFAIGLGKGRRDRFGLTAEARRSGCSVCGLWDWLIVGKIEAIQHHPGDDLCPAQVFKRHGTSACKAIKSRAKRKSGLGFGTGNRRSLGDQDLEQACAGCLSAEFLGQQTQDKDVIVAIVQERITGIAQVANR